MSPAFAEAAKRVLLNESAGEASSEGVATAAAAACSKLSTHFSRLIGVAGMRTLFDRSLTTLSADLPWLPPAVDVGLEDPWTELRTAFAAQDPDTGTQAFVALWTGVIALMGRFIGDALVARLLSEVWPHVFPTGPIKEQR